MPLVYGELRQLAAQRLAHEQPGQTLQATALVHEAYLRLVEPLQAEHAARLPYVRQRRTELMAREVSNRCVACGFGFVYGPVFTDFITIIHQQGFRRTYNFEYRLYAKMFGHDVDTPWPADVSLADCDSMFLGCVIDPDMECPKCGRFAFAERAP